MKLLTLATLNSHESKIECSRQTVKEGYGRIYNFDYHNYDTDPRPSVLILGYWDHPTSGNTLLGGINLNYLKGNQLQQLQKALPTILKPKGLKLRYRVGKKLLPDVFENYRTYKKDYVNGIEPSALKFWSPEKEKAKQDQEQSKQAQVAKAQELAKKKEMAKAAEPPPPKAPAEPAQQKLDAIKQLASMDQERDQEADYRQKLDTIKLASQGQRKQQLGKQQAIQKPEPLAPLSDAPPLTGSDDLLNEPVPEEPIDLAPESDLGLEPVEEPPLKPIKPIDDVLESRDFFYSPRVGYVWKSPAGYIRWHSPTRLRLLESRLPDLPKLMVYHTKTGALVCDRASSYAHILQETNWNFRDTVRARRVGFNIEYEHDGLAEDVLATALSEITSNAHLYT